MNAILLYSAIGALLLGAELLYFRMAERYAIVDKPNNRSSHTGIVVRGGGIIFFIALLLWFPYSNFAWPYFMLGATLVAVISFLDDVRPQRALIRFSAQLLAVLLLFYDASILSWPVYMVIIAAIVCIGTINAFNFMDGINGMTGVYALVNLACFLYIQLYILPFSNDSLLILAGIAILIFLFFNFRKKARCFAGDVGSVTISFLQIFLLLQIIVATQSYLWVIMFLVYGIDSTVTILYRLGNRENIFKAHRTHLYQYLSNELRWPQLWVSVVYGSVQLILNIILIVAMKGYSDPIVAAILFTVVYVVMRILVLKTIRQRSAI
jgi:UDP-GlcNAc:undecaprenyl-phosphate GlcNAc-1-phosphate transferase